MTAVSTLLGSDTSELQQYFDAMQDYLDVLEKARHKLVRGNARGSC